MIVKICGVRKPLDDYAGIDMIGLNFVPLKKRMIDVEDAREVVLSRSEKGYVDVVGVFQDQPLHEVFDIASDLELDRIQLHGSERNDQCRQLRKYGFKIIKAIPAEDWQAYELYDSVDMFLFDSENPGSGESYDYSILSAIPEGVKFLVAGGVSIDTIGEVVDAVPHALGVDIASGVETDGHVDVQKVQELSDYLLGAEK